MSAPGPLGPPPQRASVELAGAQALDVRGPALDVRAAPAAGSRRALLALGGLLASGIVLSLAAADTQTLLPETIRPIPASLAGVFGHTGLNLHAGGAIAVLGAMTVCYVLVATLAGELSGKTVLMGIAALHAVVLLAPPLASTDVFSYQAYARMGSTFGINPYLSGPHALGPGDPFFAYLGSKWSYIPSVYGPVFTLLSYALAPLSVASTLAAYKALATAASLGVVALVYNAARVRGINPAKAAALVGLNPLLVIYGVGGGHNDMLMLLVLTGAIYALIVGRERLSGWLGVLAFSVKLTAGVVLPFAIAAGGPLRGRGRRRDLLVGIGAGVALLGALTLAVFGSGVFNLIGTVRYTQSLGDWHSIPGLVTTKLGSATAGHIVGYALAAAFVVVSGWLLRRVWRGQTDWIEGAGWATLAMLVAASSLLPWYVAWLLPLAALSTDRRLFRATIALTCVVQGVELLGYIPHGAALPGL